MSKILKCPHCGSEEYNIKVYFKGMIPEEHKFGRKKVLDREKDYSNLFEIYRSDYIYCNNPDCRRRICRIEELEKEE